MEWINTLSLIFSFVAAAASCIAIYVSIKLYHKQEAKRRKESLLEAEILNEVDKEYKNDKLISPIAINAIAKQKFVRKKTSIQ